MQFGSNFLFPKVVFLDRFGCICYLDTIDVSLEFAFGVSLKFTRNLSEIDSGDKLSCVCDSDVTQDTWSSSGRIGRRDACGVADWQHAKQVDRLES